MENHRGGKENLRCYSLRSSKVQKRKYLQEKSQDNLFKFFDLYQLMLLMKKLTREMKNDSQTAVEKLS